MSFILQVIGWILFIYGFFSLSQDIINEITYKQISHDMKIVVFTKDLEKNIEKFSRELLTLKRSNNYKEIVVIDLQCNDDINKIIYKLENDEVNVKLLDKASGKELVNAYFQNENISFF